MMVAFIFTWEFWVLWGVVSGAFLGAFGDGMAVPWDPLGPFGDALDSFWVILGDVERLGIPFWINFGEIFVKKHIQIL